MLEDKEGTVIRMLLKIKNCNNINSAEIKIEPEKLNIKYAINGTGKSTIVKAITAFCHDDAQKKDELIPFKYRDKSGVQLPEVEGAEDIKKIAVFNDEYISNYLFQSDDLLKGTFNVFIKSPDYDKHVKEIESLLREVHETFQKHNELDELIEAFTLFIKGCGKNSSNLAKTSPLVKGFRKGNNLVNIPKGLEIYEQYLCNGEIIVPWLTWQMQGSSYVNDADKCPFCTASIKNTRKAILQVKEEYTPKDVEHLNNMLQVFATLNQYFSEETRCRVDEISKNISGISEKDKHFLFQIKTNAESLLARLEDFKKIGFFTLKKENKIKDALTRYKIDLEVFPHFNSNVTSEKIDIINGALNVVMEKVADLGKEISQQKKLISQTVSKYNREINNFLQCAGYDYTVSFENEENTENYHLKIKHNQCESSIDQVNNYLSYGEKNAFALVLFMYSALKEEPDLIVLDDPISSFDGNKKFAILDMLFKNKESLRGKTVILLTHEFSTVIDSLKNIPRLTGFVKADFLSNKKGLLKEVEVKEESIQSFVKIAKDNIGSQQDNINKLIYLRRLLELINPGSMAYEMLSSLFHKREQPSKKVSQTEFESFDDDDINDATMEIRKYIPDFDYSTEYEKITDDEVMKQLYIHAGSDYERLQLYRVKFNENKFNSVIRKYINETFHVENDYLFQLNPCEYDTVPYFVISECNREMLGVDGIEMEE